MNAMSAETTAFAAQIDRMSTAERRVLRVLIDLLALPSDPAETATPLAAARYGRMLLGVMQEDVFGDDQWADERAVIARHIEREDRAIAELEGAAPC